MRPYVTLDFCAHHDHACMLAAFLGGRLDVMSKMAD